MRTFVSISYFILLSVFLLSACGKHEILEADSTISNDSIIISNYDFTISEEEALATAFSHFGKEITKSTLETAVPLEFNGKRVAYYVNMDNGGWAIISGDKRMQPVLAFNEKGQFNPDRLSEGPRLWLRDICGELYTLESSKSALIDSPHLRNWDRANSEKFIDTKGDVENHDGEWLQDVYILRETSLILDVEHLTQTKWHQNYPWNEGMPLINHGNSEKFAVGCVTLAIGQVMYYLHFAHNFPLDRPTFGAYINNGSSIEFNTYGENRRNWDTMAKTFSQGSEAQDTVINVSYYLAGILNEIKQHSNLWLSFVGQFRDFGSVHESQVESLFRRRNIGCSNFIGFSPSVVAQNIERQLPVIVAANDVNTQAGHAWIIDGARVMNTTDIYIRQWMPIGTYPPTEPQEPDWNHMENYVVSEPIEVDSYYYFQMNWGWGDNDDSYYYYGSNWEQQIDTETLNFIRNRRIIQGFYPLNN